MATYVVEVKLPYERTSSLFAVLHSNTDTMFMPTFGESDELVAHMFAAEYSDPAWLLRDYTEAGQQRLVSDLRAFLEAQFPAYGEHMAPLPAAWRAELPQEDEEDSFPYVSDSSDLLQWYKDGDDRADVAQRAFHAWRRAQVAA